MAAGKTDMKLGIIANERVDMKQQWSGLPHFMHAALTAQLGDVTDLGPGMPKAVRLLEKLAKAGFYPGGLEAAPHLHPLSLHLTGWRLGQAIKQNHCDVLFAPAGSHLIAKLRTRAKVIYCSDTTLRLMLGYYPSFESLHPTALKRAERYEQAAIERADCLIYPSDWAARSAIEHYGANPKKVHVVPFGANFQTIPSKDQALAERPRHPLKLLFVGVEWGRKGGDLAIAACDILNQRGIATELTVVGCTPPDHQKRDYMTIIPSLNKMHQDQEQTLSDLFLSSHLFVLPTQAECFGIVFCEAAAHGLPSIAPRTGGVEAAVREGETGYLLPPDADADAYANLIADLMANQTRYNALRTRTRETYETTLNWSNWARRVIALMQMDS